MKKNPRMLGIMCMLFCIAAVVWHPARAEAASQTDWNTYGKVFDAAYYYNTYPDVAAVCGRSETALFEHFVAFGVSEGRSASAEYNPQAYRARYADLQSAYGNNMTAYCQHYLTYGRAEGRIASADGQRHARACGLSQTDTGAGQRETTVEEPEAEEVAVTDEPVSEEVAVGEPDTTESEAEPEAVKAAVQAAEMDFEMIIPTKVAEETVEVERVSTDKRMTANNSSAIGIYTTYYETGVSRATNVELAAQRINGVIIQPGDSFSFSNTILARTRANGYVEGPIFVQGRTEIGIGGGVCQVSSTLYAAMVDAELPATERHAHSRPVDYMPQGLDATIAGNYLDLKFRNIYDQPLLIQADASDGELTVALVLQ